VMTSLVMVITNAIRFNERITSRSNYLRSGLSSLDTIASDIRASKGIISSSTANKLVLDFDTYYISYDFNLGKIRRIKNLSSQYLTDDNMIKSLSFSYSSLHSATIKIELFKFINPLVLEVTCRN